MPLRAAKRAPRDYGLGPGGVDGAPEEAQSAERAHRKSPGKVRRRQRKKRRPAGIGLMGHPPPFEIGRHNKLRRATKPDPISQLRRKWKDFPEEGGAETQRRIPPRRHCLSNF